MNKRMIIVLLVSILLLTGCSDMGSEYTEVSLYDGALVVTMPSSLESRSKEEIEIAYENRQKPEYSFTSESEDLKYEFLYAFEPTEGITLELLHNYRVGSLSGFDTIYNLKDEGINIVNGSEVSQISYYEKEKEHNAYNMIVLVDGEYVFIRILYSNSYKDEWKEMKDNFIENIQILK